MSSSVISSSCSLDLICNNRWYTEILRALSLIYASSINASTSKSIAGSMDTSRSTSLFWAFAIASSNMLTYIPKPTDAILPCCCEPNRLPAPRISRSRMANLNPAPSSVNSSIAFKRFSAASESILSGRYMKYA